MASILAMMRLLQFGDSMLPVGSFSFSNGLESAVQRGVVLDPASLRDFIRTATRQSATSDGIALLHAFRAAGDGDRGRIVGADRAAFNRRLNEEARTMSTRMGRKLAELGIAVLIITNDVVTTEDAKHVQRALRGVLIEERILGVETGACPHTAVREGPSMNLAAVEDMEARFPDTDVVLIESGGDNLTLTFSPALVDFFIYVIDVAAGDKIPRKNGPGITQSDILVINKTDLAPYVGASLELMDADSRAMRGEKPFVFTNCKAGEGIDALVALIRENVLFDIAVRAPDA